MTERLVSWSPVALLLLLAGLTWWLDSKVQPPARPIDGSLRHDPDFYIEGFNAARMNPDGTKRYELTGTKLFHFPDDNSTELASPYLIYYDYERAPATVRSETARLAHGGDDVYFYDNVQIVRSAYGENPELGIFTSYLHVIPDRDFAETDKPVTMIEGNSTANSVGLEFDHAKQQVRLLSEVQARYENPRSVKTRSQPRAPH